MRALCLFLVGLFVAATSAIGQTKEEINKLLTRVNQEHGTVIIYDDSDPDLKEIRIEKLPAGIIPKEVFSIKSIKSLLIMSSQVTRIQDEIYLMPNLFSLRLLQCKIDSIPDKIRKMTKLGELVITGNTNLKYITPALADMNIQYFTYANSKIKSFPDIVFKLKNLKALNLQNNEISEIPADISKLKNLENLILENNKLTSLPPQIAELKNLKSLWLPGNNITNIPDGITQLQNLWRLNLRDNKLTTLPDVVLKIPNIWKLQLDYNRLSAAEMERINTLNAGRIQSIDMDGQSN